METVTKEDHLELISGLTSELCTAMEMSLTVEQMRVASPAALQLVRKAYNLLLGSGHVVPGEVTHLLTRIERE